MPRVMIDPAVPDGKALDTEIARLRGLGGGELRAKWHTAFRRRAPPHLPRHLLFHILAYRLQADRLGELDADSRLRQIAPYSNNSLAQSPSKLIRSHGGNWTGGRHLSYSRIRLPKRGSSHYPVCRKPAITLSRKDWHSAANR